jgi:hypothetical protein
VVYGDIRGTKFDKRFSLAVMKVLYRALECPYIKRSDIDPLRKFSFDCDLAEYWLCCNLCWTSLEIESVTCVGRAAGRFVSVVFISELRPPLVASVAVGVLIAVSLGSNESSTSHGACSNV